MSAQQGPCLPVIVCGLGPMGRRIAAGVLADPRLEVRAAVDRDPRLAGRLLSEVVKGGPAIAVRPSLSELSLSNQIVVQATGSRLDEVAPQILQALQRGHHVVSTCEELAFPFARHPELSERLFEAAVAADRTVVGTGVNPGFVMDQLPVALRGATHSVRAIRVERTQDPAPRREPFRRKVGVGMSRAEFEAHQDMGHVGLEESARLICAGMGWQIATFDVQLEALSPGPGQPLSGIRQSLSGRTADGRSLHLEFKAEVGAANQDLVQIDGTPPLRLVFEGGIFGDDATVAAVLRAARVIPNARRGLVTVLDLPLR